MLGEAKIGKSALSQHHSGFFHRFHEDFDLIHRIVYPEYGLGGTAAEFGKVSCRHGIDPLLLYQPERSVNKTFL